MVLKQEDWRRLSVRRRERERKQNSTMRSVGFKALVQLRNLVIKSIRTGYRSICHDHPFLVGTILFLVFLYRSCPLLFSLLVSASPVLVCTFALLGILLNYGNPQFPEIEVDEKSSEISSARAVRHENNTTILGKDEPLGTIDTLSDVRRVVSTDDRRVASDRGIEAVSLLDDVDLVGEPKQVESTVSHSLAPTWQSSRVIGLKEQLAEESSSEYNNRKIEVEKDINWRELGYETVASTNVAVENPHDIHEVQNQDFENDKSAEALVNGQREEDSPESSWGQWTWTKVDHDGGSGNASRANGGSDDEDESFDSGSDGAESSSPDPSMADITPLLDELYPLLENDNPDLVRQPSQSSDVATGRSHESSESNISSDGETDHDEAEEDAVSGGGGDDDEDEDDDDEEGLPNKEDEAKSAIKWTEDDQKNLMDLGSSEMERNQRLESLIARRRSRRDMRMMMERNLIDLEGMDLAPQIAPIITTRQNPFDSPNDSYNYMGLPPIPGSAPSVFSQRQNPFDLPYDSSEEKPDLTADSFQQEFMDLTQKDPLFRRHESFNIGSSTFDFHRHDRTGGRLSRFRPYFLPERIDSDGTGHSPYTRQSSDLSEASLLRRQLSGSSSFQRQASGFSESSFQRQSSDVSESKASSAAETEPPSPYADEEEMKFSSSNNSQERRPVPETEDTTHPTERGYHASSVLNSATEEQSEKIHVNAVERYTSEGFHLSQRRQIAEIKLGNSGTDAGEKSWFAATWDIAASEGRQGEIHQGLEPAKKQGSSSSLSSMSEVNDDVTEVDHGLVKEEVLEPLNLNLITEVRFNGLGMSAITEEENSSSSSSSVSSSEEYNDLNEEKKINNSPRSATLSEEYNDATEEKNSTHNRSSSASSSEEYNDAVEESKSGHSRSTSASSSEEYSDAAKVAVKVDKDFVIDHPGASELDRKYEMHAGEAQEVNVSPRASNLDESSENPSDWVQEVPTVGHTTENQEPVYDLSPQASGKLSAVSSDFHLVEETDVKDPKACELPVEDHHNVVSKAYDLQNDGQHLYSAELISDTVERDSDDVKELAASEATFSSLVTAASPDMSREVDLVKELAPETVRGELVSASNEENQTIQTENSVHSQDSESKKEPHTDDEKFEEMSAVDKLNHNIHGEVNALFEFSRQTTETNIPSDGTEQNPFTNISDVIEPVPNKSEVTPPEGDKADSLSELGDSIASDNIVYGDVEDMKEMDEAILSELDAVGDFSLGPANLGPDSDITGGDVILDKTEQDTIESGIKEERPQ